MFRASFAARALAVTLVPAAAIAGLPNPVKPVKPPVAQTFMCIGVQGQNVIAVSGTVFETNDPPIAVPQDFVSSVQADVQLLTWHNGVLDTDANTDLKGSLRSGMPTPGIAYGLGPNPQETKVFNLIESLRLFQSFQGEKTATIKLPAQEAQTIPCQVLNFPAGSK
jgi:hypothetical protein